MAALHLVYDCSERNNNAAAYPDVVDGMKAEMEQWKISLFRRYRAGDYDVE